MPNNSLSLLELNEALKVSIKSAFLEVVWVRAEISELHENANGHCYLELVEKAADGDAVVAKQKAAIWASTYNMLKPYFESVAGVRLGVGLNVLVACAVEFHAVYGLSLNIRDIDPSFTVGDMALRRAEIVRRLTDEGVVDMNKQLALPPVPQRVAVISSASAAGFGDFCDQLHANRFGYKFYVRLFAATMQGAQTEASVIAALDAINDHADQFDVVAIIRGGGATSDLAAFDNYNMALHCAEFPLPIISGIGHQRDDSIVDLVAHTRVKTPTAAAEFLIDQVHAFDERVDSAAQQLSDLVRDILDEHEHTLQRQLARLSVARQFVGSQNNALLASIFRLDKSIKTAILSAKNSLSLVEKSLELSDPRTLLQRGYTLTVKNGKIVKSAADLQPNDTIETHFADGVVQSEVKSANKN